MWPTVPVSAITDRWRPLTADEQAVAATNIGDAEAELRDQLRLRVITGTPTFDTDAEKDDWERRYTRTVVDMVRRYLGNPDGVLEDTERLDDYSRTIRRDSSTSAGLLYVDDAEVDKLIPTRRRRRGAFTIRPGYF